MLIDAEAELCTQVCAPKEHPPRDAGCCILKSSILEAATWVLVGSVVWSERMMTSVPMVYVRRVELAEKRSIQLGPGIIIHCSVVNRCHETQELAEDMKPKLPSFTGFSIYLLSDLAS